MKFGLSKDQFDFIVENVVKPLQEKGAKVYCYGSRARGDHKKYSDLDLMVEPGTRLDREISGISEVLEESNFPLKVDLVPFNEFADAYRPGYEKDKVEFV